MARIDGISDEEASFITKRVFAVSAKETGRVPDPLRIMAKSGPSMFGIGLFQMVFDNAKTVDKKYKTLACLKAAALIGCVF